MHQFQDNVSNTHSHTTAQQERIWMKTKMNESYLCIPYRRSRRLRYSLRDRHSDWDRAQRCRRYPVQTQGHPDRHCSPGTSGSASCWKWHGDIEITHKLIKTEAIINIIIITLKKKINPWDICLGHKEKPIKHLENLTKIFKITVL